MGLRLFPKDGLKVGDPSFASLDLHQICRRMVNGVQIAVGFMPLPEQFIEEERTKGEDIPDGETIPVVALAFRTLTGDDREFIIGRDDAIGIAESLVKWLMDTQEDDDE